MDLPGDPDAGGEDALAGLAAAIDRLDACDALDRGDPETVIAIFAELDRLEARCAGAAVAFEASGAWAEDGAPSAGAWLARRCHQARAVAFRHLRLGRGARKLALLGAAWSRGEVGASQVQLIVELDNETTSAALQRDEVLLVDQARQLRVEQLARVVKHWSLLADQDGAERDERRRVERRELKLSQSLAGMWCGSITLDPLSGEIVSDELSRITEELFKADHKRASERLGRAPRAEELERTSSQRRADALVEMATRSAAARAGTRYPVPLFTVLIDFESLGRVCELASGAATTPGALVKYLGEADLERAVCQSPTRLEIGRRVRLFSGATRRSVEVRDRRCVHPYCDLPASLCQVDHVIPYSEGGETTQDNGRMLCAKHNLARNHEPRRRPPPEAEESPPDEGPPHEGSPPGATPGEGSPPDAPPGDQWPPPGAPPSGDVPVGQGDESRDADQTTAGWEAVEAEGAWDSDAGSSARDPDE